MTAQRQDILLGVLFAILGLAAALKAGGYAGASGLYPMTLGLVTALLGAVIAIKALLRGRPECRPLVDHGPRAVITVALAAAYLALVPRLGFYLASILLALFLPLALGFRKPLYSVVTVLVFIATVWIVFSIVLEKPLPDGFWASY